MTTPLSDRPIPGWRELGVVGVGFLLLSFVSCFPGGIGFDQVPFDGGDGLRSYLPAMTRSFRPAEPRLAGAWDPTHYTGLPESHSPFGRYYPPTMLLFGLLPPGAALSASLVLHHAWAALGMYLLVRGSGRSRAAAALAGVAFSFGGFVVCHRGHVPNHQASAWLAWGLWTLERYRHRRSWGWIAAAGTAIAGTALPGHLQMVVLAGLAWILYAVYFAVVDWREGRSLWGMLGGTSAACLIGALGAMPQLLPMLEVARWSAYRSFDEAFYFSGSLHPGYLVGLLSPHILQEDGNYWGPVEQGIFFGLIPSGLAIAGITAYVQGRRRRAGLPLESSEPGGFFGVLLVVALLLMLGKYGLLYSLLKYAPVYNLFHAPTRHVWLFGAALAWWAAYGLDWIRSSRRDFVEDPRRRMALAAIPAAAALELLATLGDFEIHPVDAGPTTQSSSAPDYIQWIRGQETGPALARVFQQQGYWKTTRQKHVTPSSFADVWGISGLNGYCQSMPASLALLLRLNSHGNANFLQGICEERGLSAAGGRFIVCRGRIRDSTPGKGCRLNRLESFGWRGDAEDGPNGEVWLAPAGDGVARVLAKTPIHAAGTWLLAMELEAKNSRIRSVHLNSRGKGPHVEPSLHRADETGVVRIVRFIEAPEKPESLRLDVMCDADARVQVKQSDLWLLTAEFAKEVQATPAKALAILEAGLSDAPYRYRKNFEGDVQVYENPQARGLATMVREVRPSRSDHEAALAQISDRSRPARELAFVTAPGGRCRTGSLTGPLTLKQGCCEVVGFNADGVTIETQSTGEGFVVLAATRAMGWKATVDDAPRPIEAVDGALMGVWLPPGTHRVVFQFRPVLAYAGMGLALFGVGGAWLLAALLPYWRPPARNLVPVRSYARRAA